MELILISILGAFINRCRGGLINKLAWNSNAKQLEWTDFKHADKLPKHYSPLGKRIGKYGNAVAFGVVAGVLISSWYAGIAATLGMFIGSAFGWGKYIGGIINKTFDPDEVEIRWIDWLIMQRTDYAVLRSVIALSLRGLIWTSCIALATLTPLYAPIGLLMGVVYYAIISIAGAKGWSYGEYIFGGLLWGLFATIN